MTKHYDIFIIGGGINGCGIARDAAGRGYSVALCEQSDLAVGTSSRSTKLVHGGLRYLEHYEFRLVRESLTEREVLLRNAPHIIWPLRFILPHHKDLRPAWLLRLGLFLYDYIGGRKLLPPTRTLDLSRSSYGTALRGGFTTAFEYSDCWVDDARLVVLNAMDAARLGASIQTREKCLSAVRDGNKWRIKTANQDTGDQTEATADLVINAAGPWVDDVLGHSFDSRDNHNVRLVQGSHIVVPRLTDHDRCYIFQNADNRIIFAIPYLEKYTLIGTTDQDYYGKLTEIEISPQEVDYLCAAASEYFVEPVRPEQVVWTYSGVRPLYDDGASAAQEATRDYVLKRDLGPNNSAPLVNIFGGKITTFRRLAESMMQEIGVLIGEKGQSWTADAVLPGGDFPVNGYTALVDQLTVEYPQAGAGLVRRLVRAYGTIGRTILAAAAADPQLDQRFGADLTAAEVRYLVDQEWARTADDILWRRSKLGLEFDDVQTAALEAYVQAYLAPRA